jgi:hypothetical protein
VRKSGIKGYFAVLDESYAFTRERRAFLDERLHLLTMLRITLAGKRRAMFALLFVHLERNDDFNSDLGEKTFSPSSPAVSPSSFA